MVAARTPIPARRRPVVLLAGLAALLATGLAACTPYRIEHRTRPAYYARLVDGPLPDREVLDDGTVVVYERVQPPDLAPQDAGEGDNRKHFQLREQRDDGSVVLHALLPEHVIVHTLNSIRLDEYQLLWDQMLSRRTKRAYESAGQGVEEFAAFFRANRVELARMLNRMRLGLATHETVVENAGPGVIVLRFWPQTARLFKFKRVSIAHEDYGLKLLMIE